MDAISDISGEERLDIMSDLTLDGDQGSVHSDVEGWLFKNLTIFFAPCSHLSSVPGEPYVDALSIRQQLARNITIFTGATVTDQQKNNRITHVIVDPSADRDPETGKAKNYTTLRSEFATRRAIPHFVTVQWVEECWKEKTLVDEERMYSMPAIALPGLC